MKRCEKRYEKIGDKSYFREIKTIYNISVRRSLDSVFYLFIFSFLGLIKILQIRLIATFPFSAARMKKLKKIAFIRRSLRQKRNMVKTMKMVKMIECVFFIV